MNLERYNYFTSDDFKSYSFYSIGPKGRIKKTVVYSKIQEEPIIYNLAFGDEDSATGKIDDNVISNNDDRDMILATVAGTIYSFCERYGMNLYISEEALHQEPGYIKWEFLDCGIK